MPIVIQGAYTDALERGTGDLINDNIATREALLVNALTALDDGGQSRKANKEIDKLTSQLTKELASQPDMNVIDDIVRRIQNANNAQARFMDAVDAINKLLDAQSKDLERRAKIEMHEAQTLSQEQLSAFLFGVKVAADDFISDKRERQRFLDDVANRFIVIRQKATG